MTILRTLAPAALAALAAGAQSFHIGPDGPGVAEDGFVVRAPAPVSAGRELAMHELPLSASPPQFYLNVGTAGRSGPFALADGAAVGAKQAPYTLRLLDEGRRFTLHPPGDAQTAYGPFDATNGAPVTVGRAAMTLLLPPARVTVSLAHPGRIAQRPSVGIAPLTPPVLQALYDLRAKYVALANRVDYDTADAEMTNVPRVHNRITGNTFSPVVKTSGRDKQYALKGAELTAVTYLEKLFGQAFRYRAQAITDELTFHFQLPPGDYALCAMQRVNDPDAPSGAGTRMALWWTAFTFDGARPLAVALTAENAIAWREIFRFDAPR